MSTFDAIAQDLRLAARTLRKRLGFTVVAVLTLAIGIGANVAIFGAVNTMLLHRLPFSDPDRLMVVNQTRPPINQMPGFENMAWSLPQFVVFRDGQTAFSDVALFADWPTTILGGDAALRIDAEVTDDRYLPTLGIGPALGRNFTADETRASSKVVLLSDALWRERFDADPDVLGRTANLGGDAYTIIGVMPPSFHGLTGHAQLWATIMAVEPEVAKEEGLQKFTLIARLKAGVSPSLGERQVHQLGQRVDAAYPVRFKDVHTDAVAHALDTRRVNPMVRRALLTLFGAVGIVLLIVCANVANLLLVRAAGRKREIAIRSALGAPRRRLVGQLFAESALLAAIGGVAGAALAWWGQRLLVALDPTRAARPASLGPDMSLVSFGQVRFDGTALAFAAVITLGTCLLFGLLPAIHSTRSRARPGLQEGRDTRARAMLASLEVALAVVLLVGSGLLVRSLGNLLAVPLGFDARNMLTVGLGRPDALDDAVVPGTHDGKNDNLLPGYYDRVLAAVGSLPGVTGVALQDCLPVSGGCIRTPMALLDRPPLPNNEMRIVSDHVISANWPSVMRVPVIRGRAFTDADRASAPKVVLVGETAAGRLWPGEDPIGKPVQLGIEGFMADTAHVVGIVGDVRYTSPDSAPGMDFYVPYLQSPDVRVTLLARSAGDPLALVASVRRAVHEVAPNAPVFDARSASMGSWPSPSSNARARSASVSRWGRLRPPSSNSSSAAVSSSPPPAVSSASPVRSRRRACCDPSSTAWRRPIHSPSRRS